MTYLETLKIQFEKTLEREFEVMEWMQWASEKEIKFYENEIKSLQSLARDLDTKIQRISNSKVKKIA